jgi:hypothetical protein
MIRSPFFRGGLWAICHCVSMRRATHDVGGPDPGVKNEEHVAREERDREKWAGTWEAV